MTMPDNESPEHVTRGRLLRGLFIAAGTIAVGLGILGILLPVLPTTPFLLLAAACYLRGSIRMYRWLHENRIFGEYLRRYRAGEGLPVRAKVMTLMLLWGSLIVSIAATRVFWLAILLVVIGSAVSVHILRLPTRKR